MIVTGEHTPIPLLSSPMDQRTNAATGPNPWRANAATGIWTPSPGHGSPRSTTAQKGTPLSGSSGGSSSNGGSTSDSEATRKFLAENPTTTPEETALQMERAGLVEIEPETRAAMIETMNEEEKAEDEKEKAYEAAKQKMWSEGFDTTDTSI